METIQVVIDSKLLQTADRLAKRKKVNRSALVREALREYAKRERIREMEERDRRAYEVHPQTEEEIRLWENETAWLEE
jgi:metal-responsive CopG/Arc/MetJ family transcriptional regulator